MTNATWNDFWLNEGFTVYFENRIDEELYGKAFTRMLQRLGRERLDDAVAAADPRDTWLELDRAGKDPDGPATVPYEKGSLLLRLIEQATGRERFDAFLRAYFDGHAFRSIDTPTFLDELRRELLEPAGISPEDLQLEAWVHGPGVPANAPTFESDAFDIVDAQVARLLAGASAGSLDTDGWVSQQWVHFIRALPTDTPLDRLAEVDAASGLSTSGNIEVLTAWLELAVVSGHVFEDPTQDQVMADVLTRHGRALYLKRIYSKLAATPRGRERAQEIYAGARPMYHPVSQRVVDWVLDGT